MSAGARAEFAVELSYELPATMSAAERAAVMEAEAARGAQLRDQGAIVRIWRIPGRRANLGIWSARDATELHELLSSLPLSPWMDVTVRPLAVHPLERGRSA